MTIILDDYKTFESTTDLNEAIRQHLATHRYDLNDTAISALEAISRHAVKYTGALRGLKLTRLRG